MCTSLVGVMGRHLHKGGGLDILQSCRVGYDSNLPHLGCLVLAYFLQHLLVGLLSSLLVAALFHEELADEILGALYLLHVLPIRVQLLSDLCSGWLLREETVGIFDAL